MLKYPDLPNHESWLPNLIKANDLFGKFRTLMDQTPGLNMDTEIDKLQTPADRHLRGGADPDQVTARDRFDFERSASPGCTGGAGPKGTRVLCHVRY